MTQLRGPSPEGVLSHLLSDCVINAENFSDCSPQARTERNEIVRRANDRTIGQ